MLYKLRDLPESEKPRERLMSFGVSSLSDSELLAIILRSGTKIDDVVVLAKSLLVKFGGIDGLGKASFEHLTEFSGIGVAKACSIEAVYELALRIHTDTDYKRKHIKKPRDIFRVTKKLFHKKEKEIFILLSLDSRNRLIAMDQISMGNVSSVYTDAREIFKQALLRNAVSIALVHNHPSEDPTPSSQDILVTEELIKAGKLLNIAIVDHVVVTEKEYVSLKALDLFDVANYTKEGGENEKNNKSKK